MAAAPQRDPHDREREPIVESQRRIEREVGTGRPFAWSWIWIPIVIAAFWFCGWGWGSWGGWWWGHGSVSSTSSANNSSVVRAPNQPAPGTPVAGTPNQAQTPPPPGNPGTAGTPYRGSAAAANITGSGVAVLDAQNKSSFVGQSFTINNVPVQKVDNNHAVWIGTNNTRRAGPLLAVVSGNAANTLKNLTVGDRVNVTGTVEKAPPTRQAQREFSISSEDANNLQSDGVYIRANQVTRAQP
jgi:hypothetical protein